MRLVGLYADSTAALAPFSATLHDALRNPSRLEAVVTPRDKTPISVFAASKVYPTIHQQTSKDGGFIIVDGEIYNANALGDATEDAAQTAAQVLRQHGPSGLGRLDAAALICHYNASDGALMIARDRIGNVPVFYMETTDGLYWSADLPSLLPFINSPEMNPAAVDFFMASGYVPAPWTMVKGIRRLEPAHMLIKKRGHPATTTPYYQPSGLPTLELSEDEIVERLTNLLPKAVERRISDLEQTGVLLSAGVDSKVVLAAATQITGRPPKSFTFHYVGHAGDLNEASEAKLCADHFGSEHHTIDFQPTALPDMLPTILSDFGEPFSYGLHTAVLGEVRAYGVRDLLCGTGADGWFAGFQELNARRVLQANPILRMGLRAGTRTVRGLENTLRRVGLPSHIPGLSPLSARFHLGVWTAKTGIPFYLTEYIAPHWLRRNLYSDASLVDFGRQAKTQLREDAIEPLQNEPLIARGKIISTRYYGADMMQNWNHWSARATGTSIRAPYYDLDLMDLVTRLPLDRPGKPELRRYAANMMPHHMAYTKKIAQSVPITDWFNGPLKEFVEDSLRSAKLTSGGIFDGTAARRVWDHKPTHLINIDWVFWNMIVLSQWQEQFRIAPPRTLVS